MKRAARKLALIAVAAAAAFFDAGCGRRDESASPAAVGPLDHSLKSPSSLPFSPISFEEALAKARAERKLVFVDVYADWCSWCTKMDEDVFTDDRVRTVLLAYVPIKLNADKGGGRDVASRYRVSGLPAFLVLTGSGELVGRFDGYLPVEPFLVRLERSSGTRG